MNFLDRILDFLFSSTIESKVTIPSKEINERLGFCVNCDSTRLIGSNGSCINCGSHSVIQEGVVKKFNTIKRNSDIKSYRKGKLNLVYSREAKINR